MTQLSHTHIDESQCEKCTPKDQDILTHVYVVNHLGQALKSK